MAVTTRDLARITVDTPQRRLDVAVPSNVPVADLLLAFVRSGGERLGEGAASGWVLRRADGAPLSTSETLQDQGVRDGSVLYLVGADTTWPELEFDDIADAIAATRTRTRAWNPAASRWAGLTSGALGLLIALGAIVRDASHANAAVIAGAVAAALLGVGIVVARALGDARTGAVIASVALPYALVAGVFASGHTPTAQDMLVGCAAAVILGGIGLAAVGRAAEPLIAGVSAAAAGVLAALADQVASRVDAAALITGAATLLVGLVPAAAVRLGGVARWHADGGTGALAEAVERTDAVVTGLLGAVGFVVLAAGTILAATGDGWARILTVTGAAVIALRARDYASIRQRTVALLAATALALPVLVWALATGSAPAMMTAGLAIAGLFAIVAGTGNLTSPLFARVADLLEIIGTLAVVPLVCAVLGLFAEAHNLR
jgi:type VII secretion integral membrane protein EccD